MANDVQGDRSASVPAHTNNVEEVVKVVVAAVDVVVVVVVIVVVVAVAAGPHAADVQVPPTR